MARTEIPFIDLIKESWPLFKSNLVVTIGVPAFLFIVPFVVVGIPVCAVAFLVGLVVAIVNKGLVGIALFPIGLVGVILFAAAYNAVRAGWTNIMLRMLRAKHCTFMDIKSGMPWFLNFFLTMLIIGVGTTLLTLCLIVPGIIFVIRTSLAPFLVVDENLSPVEALLKSNELVTGYSWQILIYYALYGFVNLVAALIPVVGFVFSIASMGFFDLALARIYFYRIDESVALKLSDS